jgi:hypothetical protein
MRCFPHAPDALGHRAAASHAWSPPLLLVLGPRVASSASHAWSQGHLRCFSCYVPGSPPLLDPRGLHCLITETASHAWFQGRLQCFTTHPFAHSSRSTHPRPPPHPTPPHLPSAPLAPLARRRHAPPLLARRSSRSRRAGPRSSSRGSPPRTQCGWARF